MGKLPDMSIARDGDGNIAIHRNGAEGTRFLRETGEYSGDPVKFDRTLLLGCEYDY